MMQQPVMSGGLGVVSPITFPEDHDDPIVIQNSTSGGGIWGFIKVTVHKTSPAVTKMENSLLNSFNTIRWTIFFVIWIWETFTCLIAFVFSFKPQDCSTGHFPLKGSVAFFPVYPGRGAALIVKPSVADWVSCRRIEPRLQQDPAAGPHLKKDLRSSFYLLDGNFALSHIWLFSGCGR